MDDTEQALRAFRSGVCFKDKHGRRLVEMVSYSCGPNRIDGLSDTETIAIRVEGESEDGLTPYNIRDLRRG